LIPLNPFDKDLKKSTIYIPIAGGNMKSTKETIQAFVVDNFLFGDSGSLTDDVSFLDEGIIDSTGVLELVTFLEETFSISVNDDELTPENLDSLNKITTFVDNKKEAQAAA
jgi:acyl carrier protein